MSKVAKVLSMALVLAVVVILAISVTGAVFAHNGNGAGDVTGTNADCPDVCGVCDCDHDPHEYSDPGPHHHWEE